MNITLQEAITLLQKEEVVAVPTDTVYGLAARMDSPRAVETLFNIKGRSKEKALVLQVPSQESVIPFLKEVPTSFIELANRFWPGALTLILPANTDKIPFRVRAGKDNVAFRVSSHGVLKKLVKAVYPLVIPSANISGSEPLKSWKSIENVFGSHFPIIQMDESVVGIESTILSYQGNEKWKLLRQGLIPKELLVEFIII
jgi:L-threonylcarbamoyladenylate synthase